MKRFDDHPFIAIWEMTQACDLACQHCRASARPERDAAELTTAEGKRLLESLAAAHVPLVILTGGDPAKREDLVELVAYGRELGIHMGLTPSATPLVTDQLIEDLAKAGLGRLAVSIDSADPHQHDAFRGVAGSFERARHILAKARSCGIPVQINTSVHADNIGALERMVPVVRESGSVLWSVFFVVPTGRAGFGMLPTPQLVESTLEWLATLAEHEPFSVKTTAAPFYRRILIVRREAKKHGARGLEALRVNEGRGFMFISHRGDFFPSGFLPVPCGNVRQKDPIAAYQYHPVFRALRDPNALTGKCGACQYRVVCGGSRARAYAMTGSVLGSDPLCAYVPPGYTEGTGRSLRRLEVIDV